MKHLKLFEQFESTVITIVIDGAEKTFTILQQGKKVYLMLDGEVYQRLDIHIPDSDELNDDEFFMTPDVDQNIVDELEDQGFIQKLDEESIVGDKKDTLTEIMLIFLNTRKKLKFFGIYCIVISIVSFLFFMK